MNFKTLFVVALAFTSALANAQVERKLFSMEKNYNPENVLVIHTQTDKDCRFVTSPKNTEGNYVEFYWLMNYGAEKKEIHSMIRSEVKGRISFLGINAKKDSFKIRLNDLSELRHDLPDPTMEVISEVSQGKCSVKSIIHLGASGNYRKLSLKRTFCDVSKNMVGVPNGCSYLYLEGNDADTGEKISVKFKKK